MTESPHGLPLAPEVEPEDVAVDPQRLMMVGELVRLMSQSEDHRSYTIEDIEQRFLLPASMNQIRVYRTEIEPIAAVSWAFLSDAQHAKMMQGAIDLTPDDLRAGDNLWIVDSVIPPNLQEMVVDDLSSIVFPNHVGHMRVTDEDTGDVRVETYYGANRQGDAKADGAA